MAATLLHYTRARARRRSRARVALEEKSTQSRQKTCVAVSLSERHKSRRVAKTRLPRARSACRAPRADQEAQPRALTWTPGGGPRAGMACALY